MNTNQAELTNLIQAEIRQNNHQMLEAMQKMLELMMAECQKHILLADKSEFGWATVNEYQKHELAADSEDEKRIYKSEQRAKASRKQQLSNKKPLKRAFSSRLQEAATITKPPTSAIGNRTSETNKMGHKPGSCFACGKEGHWRANGVPKNFEQFQTFIFSKKNRYLRNFSIFSGKYC